MKQNRTLLSCGAARFVLGTGLAACALLAGCAHNDHATESAPAVVRDGDLLRVPDGSPLRKRLLIQPVELREAPHRLTFPATVEADPARTANVLPALTGRVDKLDVGLGDRVHRGQLLAVLDSGDLAQAYADADKAHDALDFARKALQRARGVTQAGGAAVKDLEAAQSAYAQAEAEFRRAETRLAAVGGAGNAGEARPMRVTAPVSGVVTALSIAPGMYVNDPTAALMTIADLSRVWITAEVPEDQISHVSKGEAVDIALPAWPGRTFHGTVSFVGAVLDADTRRDKVRVALANADGALKPNMFASASFVIQQPPQVFVPQSALLMNNDSTTVFVEVAPWTFERRTLELSYAESADARVVSGLKAGDRIVVSGGVLLND